MTIRRTTLIRLVCAILASEALLTIAIWWNV